jgi:hypothetical protein
MHNKIKIGILVVIILLGINASYATSYSLINISKEDAINIAKLQEGVSKNLVTIHEINSSFNSGRPVWVVNVSMPKGDTYDSWFVYVNMANGLSKKSKCTEPVEDETCWRPVKELKVIYIAELIAEDGFYFKKPFNAEINNEEVWVIDISKILDRTESGFIPGKHVDFVYVSKDLKKGKWGSEDKWRTIEELENRYIS